MIKRTLDIIVSFVGLLSVSPVMLLLMLLIWLDDFKSPFYFAPRVGKGGKEFMMVKLRSMSVGADKTGVESTSANDLRITNIGRRIRAFKLDEIPQLWNVLKGEMSLVGPRPNSRKGTEVYTMEELRLLSKRPGITDIASIVFSDEGEILKDSQDPDLDYNQLIRPWKSRLGLLYIDNYSLLLDLKLIYLTVLAILCREKALMGVQRILTALGADEQIKHVSARLEPLVPALPPGAEQDYAALKIA